MRQVERSKQGVTPIEFLGPGTKVYDSWDNEYRGVGDTNVYGSKRNIQLLFEHLGIKSGLSQTSAAARGL